MENSLKQQSPYSTNFLKALEVVLKELATKPQGSVVADRLQMFLGVHPVQLESADTKALAADSETELLSPEQESED